MGKDPLQLFATIAACPTCGCFELKGSVRCSECGTFHSGIHMEERATPTETVHIEREPVDPMAYSLSGSQALPEESFEETQDLVHWGGGSSDFTMEDSDEPPLSRVDPDELELPDPEDLSRIDS